MSTARSILVGIGILAGPIATFLLIAVLPFDYVSWLGGGLIGILLAIAVPGLFCITLLDLPRWQRAVAATLYLMLYAPAGLFIGAILSCLMLGCSV